ncbi:coiled-coil domain-containing protein 89 [Hyperolius riggenbachi]|uniref:coiled-coil domain-containing protein 89 n=1 Tax=Hyperolius riggenbachi TaxID=752182 RepID=UPI0035A3323F
MPGDNQESTLSWDEKTENSMLKSRLDEQSQLICLLKRRADDSLLRSQGLERMNEELEKRAAEVQSLLAAERRRGDQLDERFNLLASNHQEMIRFKDEYKRQNEELRAECGRLREQRHPELLEKERNIHELRAQLEAAHTHISQLQGSHQEELADLQLRHTQLLEENRAQTQEQQILSQRLKESEDSCRQVREKLSRVMELRSTEQKDADRKLDELNKEKQELLQLCMERGRTLQERQRESAEMSNRLHAADKARKEAEERFQRDVMAVDADSRVQELNARLGDSDKELEQLRKEFEAFKKHSADLLAKERELNAKLRHLIG